MSIWESVRDPFEIASWSDAAKMGVGGKVRVLIATTVGPVEVLRLTEEDPAIGRSVVCIDGTTDIAGITADYQAFVASPTGIIERLYGHSCYRMDISKQIDAGSSWQLGVFAAHALHAADRLAQEGEHCDTVLLATGGVRAVDVTVRDVTHVSKKFEQALDTLRAARRAERKVVVAVPAGGLTEVSDDLRLRLEQAGMCIAPVEVLADLTQELGLRLPALDQGTGAVAQVATLPRHASHFRRLGLAASALLVLVGALFAARHLTMHPSADPVVAESKLYDGLWEMNGEGHDPCPLREWTAKILVVGGWILISHPEKGFVRPTGEFRFTSPARANAQKTNEFSGHLFGTTGKGVYRTIGGQCAGTFTLTRVEK